MTHDGQAARDAQQRVSAILLQYGGSGHTLEAVRTLRRACPHLLEILVLDNASPLEADRRAASELEGIRFLQAAENRGFGAGNNQAAGEARGEVLLFLNNDTVTREDFVTPAVLRLDRDPGMGVVSPRLVYPDGSPQLSAGQLPSICREALDKAIHADLRRGGPAGRRYAGRQCRQSRPVEWAGGAAFFIRAELFNRLGGFDESIFLYFEDKDLCARVRRAGYQVFYMSESEVVHLNGGSAGGHAPEQIRAIYRDSQRIFYRKHRGRVQQALLSLYQRISS